MGLSHGGMLRRVTPFRYNVYDESENLVGHVQHFAGPMAEGEGVTEGWYGERADQGIITGRHPTKHHAAHDLLSKVWEHEDRENRKAQPDLPEGSSHGIVP